MVACGHPAWEWQVGTGNLVFLQEQSPEAASLLGALLTHSLGRAMALLCPFLALLRLPIMAPRPPVHTYPVTAVPLRPGQWVLTEAFVNK